MAPGLGQLTLHGVPGESNLVKCQCGAALAGQPVAVEMVTKSVPRGLTPTGKLPVLYRQGALCAWSADAALRLLCAGKPELSGGADAFARASVEQWLSYASEELQHLCEGSCGAAGAESAAATASLARELSAVLEPFLATRTFLVGDRVTLADVACCAALLGPMGAALGPKERAKLVNLTRWFETVRAQTKLDSFLPAPFVLFAGAEALAAAKEAKVAAAKAAATAGVAPALGVLAGARGVKSSVSVPLLFRRPRTRVSDIVNLPGMGEELVGQRVVVCGWARTVREGNKGAVAFVELSDGSSASVLQVVASKGEAVGFEELLKAGGTGSSHRFTGTIIASPAKGQKVELQAEVCEVLGTIDQLEYPLKKVGTGVAGHSLEFLREQAHLRSRTNMIASIARVRNACAHAVHAFFNERGFMYVHTPLITASDCEGAGEMFAVTTMLGHAEKNKGTLPLVTPEEAKKRAGDKHPPKVGDVDYKQDFFGRPAFLTVSGQLNVETYACALSDVYTFGPTFRAENSNTTRHLAEFWMIEPEMCFAGLAEDMCLAEDFLKYITQYVIDNCPSDMDFFEERVEPGLRERLRNVLDHPFQRLTYTEAIGVLQRPESLAEGKFEVYPEWGIDLGSEHERFLAEKVYKKPVILSNYPAGIKAFYMKQNPLDEQGRLTVQAMDILVPRIGEVIGGSAREENYDKLCARIDAMGLKREDFWWYLDLRKFGTVPHCGFGMGFERLIMFITGVTNIRDVIPFPRFPNNAEF
jgi:asparaginyl-tRNA synthetase